MDVDCLPGNIKRRQSNPKAKLVFMWSLSTEQIIDCIEMDLCEITRLVWPLKAKTNSLDLI